MKPYPWIERKFQFDLQPGLMPVVLERLRGTPVRIRDLCEQVSNHVLESKPNNKWSIKEHIGHLSDLETLHEGRIDDFKARLDNLRAADMSNVKTNEGNHNTISIIRLIEEFSRKRARFISRLEDLDESTALFQSIHPRLQISMRPVDMAFFTAEHDDQHLASMRNNLIGFK